MLSLPMILLWVALVLLLPTVYAAWIGAPYAPTRMKAVKKAFDEIKLTPNDVVVDLGAGDGSIIREAAIRGAVGCGYELSPVLWIIAWLRTASYHRAHIKLKNFYHADLASATVIFLFLMPQNMQRVLHLVQKKPLPKARIILSYAFAIPGILPRNIIKEPNCAKLYVYDAEKVVAARPTKL
jgi:hypothetical protein